VRSTISSLLPLLFHHIHIASTSLPVCGFHFHITPASTSYNFFFFFLGGPGRQLCCQNHDKPERGDGLPALSMTDLWSGTPLPGTACSLELSLPSPAGIWFKTPLPVGGANTAKLLPRGELVSWHPRGKLLLASEAGSVGVTIDQSDRGIPTKPAGGLLSDIGTGDPCLRLTGHTIPDRPKGALRPSLGPCRSSASKLRWGLLSTTLQLE